MNSMQNLNPPVLVLDDDQESILLVSTMLEYCDYRPLTAQNYQQAVDLLDSEHPAALILDLIMPDADSARLIARLVETNAKLPLILMSASESQLQQVSVDAVNAGLTVAASLHKPFWIDPLLNALEAALPERSAFAA